MRDFRPTQPHGLGRTAGRCHSFFEWHGNLPDDHFRRRDQPVSHRRASPSALNSVERFIRAERFQFVVGVSGGEISNNAYGLGLAKTVGIANKCTLCYDRISLDAKPACAQACPTTSIQFGDLSEMRERAEQRVATLHGNGYTEARLYGANENDGVGGTGSIFLLLDEPEVYGLPPDPVVTTKDLPDIFRKAGLAGLTMLAGAALSYVGRNPS